MAQYYTVYCRRSRTNCKLQCHFVKIVEVTLFRSCGVYTLDTQNFVSPRYIKFPSSAYVPFSKVLISFYIVSTSPPCCFFAMTNFVWHILYMHGMPFPVMYTKWLFIFLIWIPLGRRPTDLILKFLTITHHTTIITHHATFITHLSMHTVTQSM